MHFSLENHFLQHCLHPASRKDAVLTVPGSASLLEPATSIDCMWCKGNLHGTRRSNLALPILSAGFRARDLPSVHCPLPCPRWSFWAGVAFAFALACSASQSAFHLSHSALDLLFGRLLIDGFTPANAQEIAGPHPGKYEAYHCSLRPDGFFPKFYLGDFLKPWKQEQWW